MTRRENPSTLQILLQDFEVEEETVMNIAGLLDYPKFDFGPYYRGKRESFSRLFDLSALTSCKELHTTIFELCKLADDPYDILFHSLYDDYEGSWHGPFSNPGCLRKFSDAISSKILSKMLVLENLLQMESPEGLYIILTKVMRQANPDELFNSIQSSLFPDFVLWLLSIETENHNQYEQLLIGYLSNLEGDDKLIAIAMLLTTKGILNFSSGSEDFYSQIYGMYGSMTGSMVDMHSVVLQELLKLLNGMADRTDLQFWTTYASLATKIHKESTFDDEVRRAYERILKSGISHLPIVYVWIVYDGYSLVQSPEGLEIEPKYTPHRARPLLERQQRWLKEGHLKFVEDHIKVAPGNFTTYISDAAQRGGLALNASLWLEDSGRTLMDIQDMVINLAELHLEELHLEGTFDKKSSLNFIIASWAYIMADQSRQLDFSSIFPSGIVKETWGELGRRLDGIVPCEEEEMNNSTSMSLFNTLGYPKLFTVNDIRQLVDSSYSP